MAFTILGYKPEQIKKAVNGTIIAVLAAIAGTSVDGGLQWYDYLIVVGTGLSTFAGVFGSKNAGGGRKRKLRP